MCWPATLRGGPTKCGWGDSTPVECGRSTQTVHRSELAGWAPYGSCASHSRSLWGLRLHLVCTLHGLPVALTGAKADGRQVLLGILAADPALLAERPGQTLIADKRSFGAAFEAELATGGDGCCARLARASRNGSARCGRSSSRSTPPSRAS